MDYCTAYLHEGQQSCSVNLIGDSLKEPFWPQGTGARTDTLS
jgi:hypothetical protein